MQKYHFVYRIDGFYSIEVSPELKLIGVNSNMCLTYNFFLFLEWQVNNWNGQRRVVGNLSLSFYIPFISIKSDYLCIL